MIVGFQPGGTIKAARVILRPHETLPNRFNVMESEVFREHPDTYEWVLIKPVGSILPADSDMLSEPEIVIGNVLDLTIPMEGGSVYEHRDIIRLESDSEDSSGGDGTDTDSPDSLVP